MYQTHLAIAGDEPLRHLDQLHTGLRIAPPGDLTQEMYRTLVATPTHNLNDSDWEAALADDSAASQRRAVVVPLVVLLPHVSSIDLVAPTSPFDARWSIDGPVDPASSAGAAERG